MGSPAGPLPEFSATMIPTQGEGPDDPHIPDISVIIVSYETRDLTDACVRSVKRHAAGFRVEAIVVDNCSTDGTATALRAAHPDIVVISAPINGGFAYGNALGMAVARGRMLLVLNPDTELRPDTLERAVGALQADPRLGVVGALVELPDGTIQNSTIRFPSLRALAFNVALPARLQRRLPWAGDQRYASLDRSRPQRLDAVSGCFMLVKREVVETVGGFDTRFFIYGEEVEWCRRIRRGGWEIEYRPEVRILHHGGASTNHMTVWKAREMMRGQLLYFALTHGRGKARLAALLMLLRDLVRLPLALAGAATAAGRERARAVLARLSLGFRSLLSPPRGQSLPDSAFAGGSR